MARRKQDPTPEKPKLGLVHVPRPPAAPAPPDPPIVALGPGGLAHATTLRRIMDGQAQLDLSGIINGNNSVWGPDGRYSTAEVQAMVLEGIGQGMGAPAVLTALDKAHGGRWPSPHTVYAWRRQFPAFGRAYKDAQASRGEVLAEAAMEVAMATDSINAGADGLRVKTLQWMAARVAPQEFGEKTTVEHQHTVKNLTDEEIDRRLAELNADPELQGIIDAIVIKNDGNAGAPAENQ